MLVDRELLLIALQLLAEVLDTLLEVLLASLCSNKRLTGLCVFLSLER
jgi:hypothetical protein